MAELVDALDSKSSSREGVRVRPPLRVPFQPSFFMEALIRRGRESDMPALRDIINHYIANSIVTFEMVEMSLENRQTWFTQFTDMGRYQLFVAEKDNEVVGYAASLRFHQRPAYAPSVMTSIYLKPGQQGQGIGVRIYGKLLDELKKVDDAHRAYGLVVLPNPGSEKLHEKLGFQIAGLLHEGGHKFGKYHDVRIYEHRLGK
jgi:phosphinothricin acetyltransferase